MPVADAAQCPGSLVLNVSVLIRELGQQWHDGIPITDAPKRQCCFAADKIYRIIERVDQFTYDHGAARTAQPHSCVQPFFLAKAAVEGEKVHGQLQRVDHHAAEYVQRRFSARLLQAHDEKHRKDGDHTGGGKKRLVLAHVVSEQVEVEILVKRNYRTP